MSLLFITPENFVPLQKDAYCPITLLEGKLHSSQRTVSIKYMWGNDKTS